jgi:molybdopterin molybdotransferase
MSLSCFDLGERMLSVEEARRAILALADAPLGVETLPLADLHGRVLAEPAVAPGDVPPHTNAAMDGVALAWPMAGPWPESWRVVGRRLAGREEAPLPSLGPGDCVRITTGAAMPPQTDTVIMQEQLEETAGASLRVKDPDRVRSGQHVRQAGEDIPAGAIALPAGTRLSAAELGLLASLGLAEARVRCRPRVAIFSTGDEVTEPGVVRPARGLFDANRYSLQALVAEHGGEVLDLGILADDPQALGVALEQAAERADLVITSGGVSVGEADFTRAALASNGELEFWRIAIRPGRPLACGRLGAKGTPFLGLPGNPVAVMVTFLRLVVPLLGRLQGRSEAPDGPLTALAEHALRSRVGRVDYLRGVYRGDDQGRLWVRDTGAQGSGILSSMVRANCLIELPDDRDGAVPGEAVTVHPLYRLP